MLDQLTREVKRELEMACFLAPNAKPPSSAVHPSWISRERLSSRLGLGLRASQYRGVTQRLALLNRYKDVAVKAFHDKSAFAERTTAHQRDLVHQIIEILDSFSNEPRKDTDADESTGYVRMPSPAHGMIDELGRAYARGRRKVSSARVWLVRTKPLEDGSGMRLGEILVNNAPLSQYFTRTAHREVVTWPMRLAGVLGMYNIFAIVRGGGASGQAGALAHGISNALVAALGTAPGADAAQVQMHVQQLLARGTYFLTFLFFVCSWLTYRRRLEPRSTHGRAQETRPCQSTQGIHLGQALKHCRALVFFFLSRFPSYDTYFVASLDAHRQF